MILLLTLILFAQDARADDAPAVPAPRIVAGPLFAPEGPGEGQWRLGVGAQMDILPVELVESEQRQIPEVTADLRYGLPKGFTAETRFSGVVIKNSADLGGTWAYSSSLASFGVFARMGIRFGSVSSSAFDASTWGLVYRPGFTIGMPWKNIRFSFSEEFTFAGTEHVRLGDLSLTYNKTFEYEGLSATFIVETFLKSGHSFYFGAAVNWSNRYDEAWLALSTANLREFYPRILGGYAF